MEGHDRAPRGRRRGAEHEAGEVDGEEPRAVEGLGGAERERGGRHRGDGVQAGRRQPHAPQEQHGAAAATAEPDARSRSTSSGPRASTASSEPEVGVLDRLDAADHEQDRDRVVDARLALERARQPPPQRRPAQHREHRGGVGRRHGRAEQQRLSGSRSNSSAARRPPSAPRSRSSPSVASRIDVLQHGPDLVEARRQAALEQDERERDDADLARELEVVELDQLEPVGPDQPCRAPSTSTRPGMRRRPAASEAASPAASRTPTNRSDLSLVHGPRTLPDGGAG